MKISAWATMTMIGLACGAAAAWAQSANVSGDADFRKAQARLYESWYGNNIFSCAYDIQQKTVSEGITTEDHYELRLTYDPGKQRYICEKHSWTMPPRGRARPMRYWFYRWDGKVMAQGATHEPRLATVDGHLVEKLADVPVGTPLCGSITVQNGTLACASVDLAKEIIGLSFNRNDTQERLMALWGSSETLEERPADAPANQLRLTLGKKHATFDMRLGLLMAQEDDESPKLTWQATKFVDRVPAEVTLRRFDEGALPATEMKCRALPGQCGIMGRDQFESLLKQPFPADVGVTDRTAPFRVNAAGPILIPNFRPAAKP
jgi:hypothetical protein